MADDRIAITSSTMRRPLPWLRVLGENRREFAYSIGLALVGWLFFPTVVTESHGMSAALYIPRRALRLAAHFVFAFTALLCAVNAYRDKRNHEAERFIILAWCVLLLLWMCVSASGFLNMWDQIARRLGPL